MNFIRKLGSTLWRWIGISNVLMVWPMSDSTPLFLLRKLGKEKRFSLEVYILNFHQDIYGEEIQVDFKRRIRDEVRFDSPSHLIQQIQKDIQWAQENVFPKMEAYP